MIDLNKTIIAFNYQGNEINEISRNLKTLYSTPAGSIPLDREFGLSQDFLSYPLLIAQNILALEIIEKTEVYESRVEVLEVTFQQKEDSCITNVLIGKRDLEGDE